MKALCKAVEKPAQTACFRRKKFVGKRDPHVVKYQTQWTSICDKWGFSPVEAERRQLRHSILIDLFGEVIPLVGSSEWKWDCIYLAQDFLLENGILWWEPATAKCAVEMGLCKRYIWNIEHAGHDIKGIKEIGAPEEYIDAVAVDKFGVKNWRALNSEKLFYLFITIKNRVRTAFKEGRSLYEDYQPIAADGYIEADDDFPF